MTKSKFKPYVLLWLSTFAIGALSYVPLYATSLTNDYDGLWSPTLYYADQVEISVGRWFWPVLDTLRQGYAASLFNSLLMLALIACGTVVLFDCFNFVGKRRTYIYASLIPVSVTVCAQLSYRHMAPTFGLGFFLSVLAVWFLAKEKSKKFFSVTKLLSVVALTLTLGLYQAFLGVFCVVLLFCFLCRVCSCEKPSQSWRFLLGGSVCCAVACCVYKLLWDAALFFTGITLSEYMGASSVSFGSILLSLPRRLLDAYRTFFDYFLNNTIRHNLLQGELLYFVLLGLLFSLPLFCAISFFCKEKTRHRSFHIGVCASPSRRVRSASAIARCRAVGTNDLLTLPCCSSLVGFCRRFLNKAKSRHGKSKANFTIFCSSSCSRRTVRQHIYGGNRFGSYVCRPQRRRNFDVLRLSNPYTIRPHVGKRLRVCGGHF